MNSRRLVNYLTLCLCLLVNMAFAAKSKQYVVKENQDIEEAICMASDGDTILVMGGMYKLENLIINKPLHLIGIHRPIIDGQFKDDVITVSGKNVTISGFVLQNSGYSGMRDLAGIRCIDAVGVRIEGNTILNCHFGIHVSNSSEILVMDNQVKGKLSAEQRAGNGIHLWKCDKAKILNNYIAYHRDGIYFEFVTHSVIQDNVSEFNLRYGLHFMFSNNDLYHCNAFRENGAGVAVMYSKYVQMDENLFYKNWGASAYGLLLKEISDSKIYKNVFINNTVGIHFEGSSRIHVTYNEFANNGWAMKVQANCIDNFFTANNFIDNSFDVATNGSVSLNYFEKNYWDNYFGYDLNKDNVGDIPYYPVSLYSVIVEVNPYTILLMRSVLISLLDIAEKAIPSITPANLMDRSPVMQRYALW